MKVAVIQGGPSTEASVSRASAEGVRLALVEAGHQPEVLELDSGVGSALLSMRPDVVFPVVHGAQGEDGCVQGLLEVLGIPYVGCDVRSSAIAADKVSSKVFFERAKLPLAGDRVLSAQDVAGVNWGALLKELREQLEGDLIVKPAQGGSTIGISRVLGEATGADLEMAVRGALELDRFVLIERYFRGLELTCSVLERESGVEALPITLITSESSDWYDFSAKYSPGGSSHQCPAPIEPTTAERIQSVALEAHRCLGARDLSRSDFLLAENGEFILLELNTLPGMTETSLFPEAALAAGISFAELTDGLVRRAASRSTLHVPKAPALPGR